MGTEAVWDELPSGRERRRDVRSWTRFITEAGAASASFMLSLAVFSVAGLNAFRGSQMVVLPVEQVLLYRDGVGDRATLSMALPVKMINAAGRDYGDVMVDAQVTIAPKRPGGALQFGLQTFVEPVFALDPNGPSPVCSYDVRCVALKGTWIIERPAALLDVPGSSSRTQWLGFRLESALCKGDSARCAQFYNFDSATRALGTGAGLRFDATLAFHGDGTFKVSCIVNEANQGGRAAIIDYLRSRGWTNLTCAPSPRR